MHDLSTECRCIWRLLPLTACAPLCAAAVHLPHDHIPAHRNAPPAAAPEARRPGLPRLLLREFLDPCPCLIYHGSVFKPGCACAPWFNCAAAFALDLLQTCKQAHTGCCWSPDSGHRKLSASVHRLSHPLLSLSAGAGNPAGQLAVLVQPLRHCPLGVRQQPHQGHPGRCHPKLWCCWSYRLQSGRGRCTANTSPSQPLCWMAKLLRWTAA